MSQGKIGDSFESGLLRREINLKGCIDEGIWIDGQFNPHDICEMEDSYIVNCIAFLNEESYSKGKREVKLPEILKILKKEYLELFETELDYRQKEYTR